MEAWGGDEEGTVGEEGVDLKQNVAATENRLVWVGGDLEREQKRMKIRSVAGRCWDIKDMN